MCEQLSGLRQALVGFGRAFDAALLSVAQAEAVIIEASTIERVATMVKALAAARAARHAGEDGAPANVQDVRRLAGNTGTSVGTARHMLDLGRRLARQPELAERARSGGLSTEQAGLIAEAGEACPSSTETLIAHAESGASVAELRQQVAQVKAAARTDPEAHRQYIHRKRRLRTWTDQEGVWHISGCGNPERGAQLDSALAPLAEESFDAARRSGQREHPDAYRFDALITLAQGAASQDRRHAGPAAPDLGTPAAILPPADGRPADPRPDGRRKQRRRRRTGAPVKLLLRVDLDAFLRGIPIEGETCELVGYGPISMSAVHELLAAGDPFIAAILTKAKRVVGVAHVGRHPTAHQRSALDWIYPSCAVLGCPHQAYLETDHRIDWSKTHFTVFDLLDRLCRSHHRLKTTENWALVSGNGKRAFVPPTDPRHPGYPAAA